MKDKFNIPLEARAVILIAIFFTLIAYSRAIDPTSELARAGLTALQVADLVSLLLVIRKLWKTKWKKKLKATAQKVFSKFVKRLMAIIDKLNAIRGKDKKILSGKTTVTFDFSRTEIYKPPKRSVKWKNLRSDRERLGYLYRRVVEFNIKHGLLVYPSDTPAEIRSKKENELFEDKIYGLYIDNRYSEFISADTETLEELKKELGKK